MSICKLARVQFSPKFSQITEETAFLEKNAVCRNLTSRKFSDKNV
jgi:hypothetical protein